MYGTLLRVKFIRFSNRSKMKDWKIRLILFTSVFYFNACAFVNRRYYTDPGIYFEAAKANAPYDAVIVPGFPHVKDSMTSIVQNRVLWAWYLYENGFAKNVIFSGGAVYTPYKESEIMAMYAIQLGIPKEHVFVDTQAEHSTENLYYSYKIAQKNQFKRVAFATDIAQSSFVYSLNNEELKIPVDFIPIVYDTLKTVVRIEPNINQQEAHVEDFVSIVDRESIWKRLRGTRGDKVKKMMRGDRMNSL